MSPFSSILSRVNRNDRPLNILTGPTHERYETELCKTGHNFFSLQHPSFKQWNKTFAEIPPNYRILNPENGKLALKFDITFDLVLSQNKFSQYKILSGIADQLRCPLISLEHTLPHRAWDNRQIKLINSIRGNINVFISEYSVRQWGFDFDDPSVKVIHHGIDIMKFSGWVGGDGKILSVCNDWINRDWCCGFSLWKNITNGLPVNPVGATPGLSMPAKNIDDLVQKYQNASVFLNTSTVSPIPTSLLEAMSVGCPVVSTATCMIPSIITNGVDGYCSNDPQELKIMLIELLNNKEKAAEMGRNARQKIMKSFSSKRFVEEWNDVFARASNI